MASKLALCADGKARPAGARSGFALAKAKNDQERRMCMSARVIKNRQHPIKLLSYTTRYFWLLLIPLARSLYSIALDVNAWATWIRGAWLDLVVLAVIFAFAWVRWMNVYFYFNDEKIILTKGIIAETKTSVLFSEISTLSITQNLFYRLFGACTVKIGTNAGFMDSADVTIVMKKSDADRLYLRLKNSKAKSLLYSISPNKVRLWAFSLLFSSSLSGAALTVALLLEISQMIDRELEARLILDTLTEAANRFGQFVPPIAAAVAIVVIAAWAISFVSNIFSFWDHIITKSKDSIYIRSGLFIKNRHIIPLKKINCIELRQNLASRIFKVSTINVHACGFGTKSRSESSVLLPIAGKKEILRTLKEVFPEYPKPKTQIRSDIKSVGGFYVWPIIWALIPPAALWIMYLFLPDWYSVVQPAALIAEIPAVWLAIVKTASVFTTGIGYNGGYFTLSYAHIFTLSTVIVPKDKVTKVTVRQSPFQHINGTCTVLVYTASDSHKVHRIFGLRLDRALNFFDQCGMDMYFTENPQG